MVPYAHTKLIEVVGSFLGKSCNDVLIANQESVKTELTIFKHSQVSFLLYAFQYLAWSLKWSKAVNKCCCLCINADQGDLRFRDLVGRTSQESSNSLVKSLVKGLIGDTIIGIALWALYEQFQTAF
jgi:hypothetical protein